jgi:hypothetical protein
MLDKLKRKSILNCELFKDTDRSVDNKQKNLMMTEKLGEVLGIKLSHLNAKKKKTTNTNATIVEMNL